MNEMATSLLPSLGVGERRVYFVIGSPGTSLFLCSWLIVFGLGVLPLAEAAFHRPPALSYEAVAGFLVASASAALLRRRYSWIGIVLHIYSQVMIWLSLAFMSMAVICCVFAAS